MKPFYFISKLFSLSVFKLFYRFKVFGVEHIPSGGAIIAPSHTSYLDPIAVGVAWPGEIHFLAYEDLFKTTSLKWVISRLNAHPISGTTKDLASFRLVGKLLRKDKKIVIFPEGQRTRDGKLGTIKPGIGMLAQKHLCTIIPVYIHGAFDVWPPSKKYPKRFGKIAVVIGSPITPQSFWSSEKRRAQTSITTDLEKSLKALRNWYLKGAKGTPP